MTKAKLRAYRDIKLERDRLAAMIAGIKYGPTGSRLDGMPRGSSGRPSDPTGTQAVDNAQLLALYEHKVAELSRALVEIETAIECLAPRERTLIRLYYAEGLTWEEVSAVMHYSWRQVHYIHAKVLEKLKEV